MKTLEERLMDAGERFNHETDPTGSLWVALHDVLAIVADAPRIYRGEEIKDAPDGRYATMFDPVYPDPDDLSEWRNVYAKHYCVTHVETMTDESGEWIFFGPLPANSPSEGK